MFCTTIETSSEDIDDLLAIWQHYCNWDRPHGAHKCNTPMERYFELPDKKLITEDDYADYQTSKERIQEDNYKLGLKLA